VKFVCDRCGKKYATAEEPSPGRVYKLKCKACGNLIVVKASAGGTTVPVSAAPGPEAPPPPSAGTPFGTDLPHPQATSDADLGVAPPPIPSTPPPIPPPTPEHNPFAAPLRTNGAASAPPPRAAESTQEISSASVTSSPASTPEGYIDLFGEITGEAEAKKVEEDPFVAAARASLPADYGSSATGAPPDPFASVREMTPPPRPPPRHAVPSELVSPSTRAAEKARRRSSAPVVMIVVGGALVAGITVFVLVGGRNKTPAPAPRPAPALAAPIPAPPPEPARPEPARPEPVAVAKATPPPAPPPKAEEKRAEKVEKKQPQRQPERKPERKPEPKVAVAPPPKPEPRPEPKPEPRARPEPRPDVDMPDAAASLSDEQVNKVIASNRRAFESCISAARGSDVALDGRKVALRLTVNPNGFVTYPTLDDVTLNSTELGSCLKSAARLMVFPKFKGDPFHAEVPLLLKQ